MRRCFVIGDPIAHSLSPVMHQAGFSALSIDSSFTYEARRVAAVDLAGFLEEMRRERYQGVSVTAPHKEGIVELVDALTPSAREAASVNTVFWQGDSLVGDSTDGVGVVRSLEEKLSLHEAPILILGAGGAACAAAAALLREGARISVWNRTQDRARGLARRFGCGVVTDQDLFDVLRRSALVVHATSGGGKIVDSLPGGLEWCTSTHVLLDLSYGPRLTPFLHAGLKRGAQVVDGREVLLYQGARQFEIFTGLNAPVESMRRVVFPLSS